MLSLVYLWMFEANGPTAGPCANLDYHWVLVWIFIATLSHARGTVLLMREAFLLLERWASRRSHRPKPK
jgi:hypothetical protein